MCCQGGKVDMPTTGCRLCVVSEVKSTCLRSTTGCRMCVVSGVRLTTGVGCVMSVR